MTRRAGLAVVVMVAAGGLRADLRGRDPGSRDRHADRTGVDRAGVLDSSSQLRSTRTKHDDVSSRKLTSLRADFGRDLSKLSSGDRDESMPHVSRSRGAEDAKGI